MSELPKTFVQGFHDEDAVRRMRYNPLGQTGLKISHLSIGGAVFSNIYGDIDEEEAIFVIQDAIKKGINYIDTAPWYGQGRSEEIIGKALKDVPRQAYYIATKVGRYELHPEMMFDFSSDKTLASVSTSLAKLQLDYVDVIQIHDVEFAPNMERIIHETLPTLEEIVRRQKATYIGITGYPLSVLKECVQKSQTHIATILSYSRMTLIDDTLMKNIPYFQMQGIGIINGAAHCMGLLTNNGPQPWHVAQQETKDICREAAAYCKERGVELGRLAMHYAFKQSGPATHLVSMNTRELLNCNLEILYSGISQHESTVLEEINTKFLSKLQSKHWEGVELAEYKKKINR